VSREPKWISRTAALAIHELLLAEHGGPEGLIDEGRLDAALASPRNHFAYDERDIFRLAAAYAHAVTRDHPFKDGNKRMALTLAGVSLELNGYQFEATEADAVGATLALSTRELDEVGFASWLRGVSKKLTTKTSVRKRPARPRPKAKRK
jgi:death-on-curing protein